MIYVTVDPADEFELIDNVPCRDELIKLGVAWPNSAIFGILDILMFLEFRPLYKVRITLDNAAYHHVESTENAFREAGRDAGRKIADAIKAGGLLHR